MPPSLDKKAPTENNSVETPNIPPISNSITDNTDHAAEQNYTAIDWFKKALRNYVNFSGRARRKEYWYFVLVQVGLSIIAVIIDSILFDSGEIMSSLLSLALFLPSLAVGARRLHDIDRSGWWLLLMFLPIIGAIVLIVFFATDTKYAVNKWGAPAKRVGS